MPALRIVTVLAIAVATIIGIVVAPAMTFFAALAVATLVGLDRSARAAEDVFTGLAAR